jgi:alpha/beta superfamily hydrolase
MKRLYGVSCAFLLIAFSCYYVHDTDCSPDAFFTLQSDGAQANQPIAVILPGKNQNVSQQAYHTIGTYFRENGIQPCYVDLAWKEIDLDNMVDVSNRIATEVLTQYPHAKIVVLGFSFGAVLALKMSEALHPDLLLLCSLSPVFAEDLPCHPFYVRSLLHLLTDYRTNQLMYPPDVPERTLFLYGDHDAWILSARIRTLRQNLYPRSRTVIIPGARHDLSGKTYQETIRQVIAAFVEGEHVQTDRILVSRHHYCASDHG